jgi:hypothetical protein
VSRSLDGLQADLVITTIQEHQAAA